jgi:hypothetical protein
MASSRFGCRDGFTLAGRMTDRRGTLRAQAARLVQVAHDGEAAYARCRDFSDTGMKLDLTAPLALNDEVTIALSPSIVICGTVTWVHGRKCGIIFDGPVDSDALLAAIAEARSEVGSPATLDLLHGRDPDRHLPPPQTRGGSQAAFKPGLSVTVMVAPNRERRGVVHWIMNDATALEFAPAEFRQPYQGALPPPDTD